MHQFFANHQVNNNMKIKVNTIFKLYNIIFQYYKLIRVILARREPKAEDPKGPNLVFLSHEHASMCLWLLKMLFCFVVFKVHKECELIAIYFHMKSKQISCCLPIVVVTMLGGLELICFDFIWNKWLFTLPYTL